MQINCYSLFDTKAGYFGLPFYAQTHGEAMRICIDAAQDMRSTIARYPNDFILHWLGIYDNSTGQVTTMLPDSIGTVGAMLPRQPSLPMETLIQETSNNG